MPLTSLSQIMAAFAATGLTAAELLWGVQPATDAGTLSEQGLTTHSQGHAMGLTLRYSPDILLESDMVTEVSCENGESTYPRCNPVFGDTACETPLPVLCIRDLDLPAPSYIAATQGWSGGVMAVTQSVAATGLSSVDDMNTICAATFGQDWRIVSYQDGYNGHVRGYGYLGTQAARFWADNKEHPEATCWGK